MMLLAILLLLLAGVFLVVERGEKPVDRLLRWMVMVGAVGLAILIGGGALS